MEIVVKPVTANVGCQDPVLLNEWHVVGMSSDFACEILYPVRLLDRELVAWRSTDGQIHVWEDLCIHRGAPLSRGWIKDDRVICPYHGWNYDGTAKCVLMPAAPADTPMKKAKAFPHKVQEKYGFVWACLGEPTNNIPDFKEWDDKAFKKVICGPWEFNANPFRAIENFLDATHFPFVHNGTNGNIDAPDVIPPYDVELTEEGLITSDIEVKQPKGDARGIPVISNYVYRAYRPLVGYLLKKMVDADADWNAQPGTENHYVNLMTIQPVTETRCILRVVAAFTMDPGPSDHDVKARLHTVFTEDQAIIERQRPERIPADLRYELHHRTDLMGQRYRQWLRAMNITYGVV